MMTQTPTSTRPRVVIVGAGFGGLGAARKLRRAPVDVTVIDRTNYHLFEPLVYQVATGILSPGEIAPPLRRILRRQHNVAVVLGEVTGADLQGRQVAVGRPDRATRLIPYDYLVLAAGTQDSYFGHDEWADHLYPMKTLASALRLRQRVLAAYEQAAACAGRAQQHQWTSFAIVGAGPTGVEIAGQLATLSHELRRELREIDTTRSRIVLIDTLDEVLTSFSPVLRRHAHKKLTRMGVDILLGAKATGVDDNGITVTTKDGRTERILTRTVIWAAGVQASPLAAQLGAACGADVDRQGRVSVNPDCSLPGHPEVFVIGDMANLNELPGLCEPAMQEGRYVAKVLRRVAQGKPAPGPFTYRNLGAMATISGSDAIADAFGLKLRGPIGKLAWAVVHIAFLVGWGNRAGIFARWMLRARTRPERMILPASGPDRGGETDADGGQDHADGEGG